MGEARRRGVKPGRGGKRSSRGMWWLLGGLVVVLIAAYALLEWLGDPARSPLDDLPRAAADAPPFPAELDRFGVSVGSPQAPVVVREFADYQCPGCATFAESVQRLRREYVDAGKVRFVYFDFPLAQHRNAVPAARAARCAGDQQGYWPMQELLFSGQSRWSELSDPLAMFSRFAGQIGLNTARFESCMRSNRHRDAIERSLAAARQLRLSSTPSVFVDNIQLTRPSWYQLSGVVERQLSQD